jgi:hypothetical protein
MRTKYSIGILAFLAAAAGAGAQECPPVVVEVAREVAALRAVPAPFSPPCRLITADALAKELDRKLRRDLPVPPELFLEALWRLGLIDETPAAVYPRLLDFYTSQVLGFYEPGGNELVIVRRGSLAESEGRLVWSHELAHAAQERTSRLPSRLLAMRHDTDEQRAASAVAEGEAMLVMTLLSAPGATRDDLLDLAETAMAAQAEAGLEAPGVPDFFVKDLLFPYTAGFSAVLRTYRSGGWPAVDRMLRRPPASTAALLHPDRPAPGPPIPDSAMPAPPAGTEEVITDALGEWTLSTWLARRLPAERAAALAAGWDADRIRLVRDRADATRWAMAWHVRCRTAAERQALEAALQADLPALLARLPGAGRRPELVWSGSGATLDLRVNWP